MVITSPESTDAKLSDIEKVKSKKVKIMTFQVKIYNFPVEFAEICFYIVLFFFFFLISDL